MIRLHHSHQSRSMRTLWLLNELDIPFELVIQPFDKSLRDPKFLAVNPAGRVPALEIDGESMFETGAITEYLCETYSPNDLGRMPGTPERRAWLIWVHFSETISQHTAALTQQHVMLYEDHMRSAIITKLEAKRIEKCYAALEVHLANVDHPYLLSGGFSAADVSIGQAIYMARHFARIEPFPALLVWYENLVNRPAFEKSLPPLGEGLYPREFFEPLE